MDLVKPSRKASNHFSAAASSLACISANTTRTPGSGQTKPDGVLLAAPAVLPTSLPLRGYIAFEVDKLTGHRLELVPKRNLLAIQSGDGLPLLALFDGNPWSARRWTSSAASSRRGRTWELPKFKTGVDDIARSRVE